MTNQTINVLLLAAGLGTRLGHLTKSTPKALANIASYPTIDYALWQLKRFELTEIFINIHYLGEQIENYLKDGSSRGFKIRYSKEDPILDTGGAIKRIFELAPEKDLLVMNCDSLFGPELDLKGFINDYQQNPCIAQLLVVPRIEPKETPLWVSGSASGSQRLVAIGGPANPNCTAATFSGIQLISNRSTSYMSKLGMIFATFKSLYPAFLSSNEQVSVRSFSGYWQDTGTPERIALAEMAITNGLVKTPVFLDS